MIVQVKYLYVGTFPATTVDEASDYGPWYIKFYHLDSENKPTQVERRYFFSMKAALDFALERFGANYAIRRKTIKEKN